MTVFTLYLFPWIWALMATLILCFLINDVDWITFSKDSALLCLFLILLTSRGRTTLSRLLAPFFLLLLRPTALVLPLIFYVFELDRVLSLSKLSQTTSIPETWFFWVLGGEQVVLLHERVFIGVAIVWLVSMLFARLLIFTTWTGAF